MNGQTGPVPEVREPAVRMALAHQGERLANGGDGVDHREGRLHRGDAATQGVPGRTCRSACAGADRGHGTHALADDTERGKITATRHAPRPVPVSCS